MNRNTEPLRSPIYGLGTGAFLTPQQVAVNEVWRDWHRTDSWLGPVWFRLHGLDAADGQDQIEVGLSNRTYDRAAGKTFINAKVQTGPGLSGSKELVQTGFSVWFYNEQGERIGVSDGVTASLTNGQPQDVRLSVDGDVTRYAYATVHIGMLQGRIQSEVDPSASMEIADPAKPGVRIGAVRVRQEGEYIVVQGQFEADMKGPNRVKGMLSFLDADGKVLGKAPLEFVTDASYSGKGNLRAFESVFSGDVSGYTRVQLEVTSVEGAGRPNS
ncbi:hypothetical protein LJK88_46640 [Paenibacillus sp. P26]|nr:hypothetical protein LJK88_46640 [Paenibacillus sp. P26]